MKKTSTMTMITTKKRRRIDGDVDDEEAVAGEEKGGVNDIDKEVAVVGKNKGGVDNIDDDEGDVDEDDNDNDRTLYPWTGNSYSSIRERRRNM